MNTDVTTDTDIRITDMEKKPYMDIQYMDADTDIDNKLFADTRYSGTDIHLTDMDEKSDTDKFITDTDKNLDVDEGIIDDGEDTDSDSQKGFFIRNTDTGIYIYIYFKHICIYIHT
jgi:hypothetical protein